MDAFNIIGNTGKRQNDANDIGFCILGNTGEEQDPPSGGSGTGTNIVVQVTATEAGSKYQVLTAGGQIANSATLLHKDNIIGVALSNFIIGQVVDVQTFGEIVDVAWTWTAYNLFLNGTVLSETVPTSGFLKVMGQIKNANTIFIDISESILL